MGDHRFEILAEDMMGIDQAGQPDPLQPGGGQAQIGPGAVGRRDESMVVRKWGADRPGEAGQGLVEAEEAGGPPAVAPDRHPGVLAQGAHQHGEVRAQERIAEFGRRRLKIGPGSKLTGPQLRGMDDLSLGHLYGSQPGPFRRVVLTRQGGPRGS